MDIQVGQKATRSLTLTKKHVDMYAEMTGDYNPLHFDEDFAKRTKFGGLIVQGGLTTGILNALVAMDMPGPGTVFLNHDIRFTGPVYIGDTITAYVEVTGVHPEKPVVQLAIEITRQTGETVVEGTAACYRMLPRD